MIIANYTEDPITWTHIGEDGTIGPDEVVEVYDARGRFILNQMGRKGLVQLQFGDDPEDKKKVSKALWEEFWTHQITVQNQFNEDQKEKGQRYGKPTKKLVEHAKKLNLELLSPWTSKKKDDSPALEELRKENRDMRSQLALLMKMLAGEKAGISDLKLDAKEEVPPQGEPIVPEVPEVPEDPEKIRQNLIEKNRRTYKSQQYGTFLGWVKNSWDLISEMPEENRMEISERFTELYGIPFPANKPK